MKNINPTQTQAWKALEAHFAANKERQLKDLFAADAERFNKFSTTFGGDMLVDYSKNLITQETMALLQDLAKETDLSSAIESMFNGEKINDVLNENTRAISDIVYFASAWTGEEAEE